MVKNWKISFAKTLKYLLFCSSQKSYNFCIRKRSKQIPQLLVPFSHLSVRTYQTIELVENDVWSRLSIFRWRGLYYRRSGSQRQIPAIMWGIQCQNLEVPELWKLKLSQKKFNNGKTQQQDLCLRRKKPTWSYSR